MSYIETSTAIKPVFWIFPDTQTGINKLNYTATGVKTSFKVSPYTQTGVHNFHMSLQ